MSRDIKVEPLSAQCFAMFGEVLDTSGEPDSIINEGRCGRYHDQATLDFLGGRAGISLFDADPCHLPYALEMVERHPLGSQAFLPMTQHPFLVIVAPDEDGGPGTPRAFVTAPGQGVNLARNVWHGVLTPLHAPGLFTVVDRIGTGNNLQEHRFATPWRIVGGD